MSQEACSLRWRDQPSIMEAACGDCDEMVDDHGLR